MDGGDPVGGHWNYDAGNRMPLKGGLNVPKPYNSQINYITREVMALVSECFPNHFGDYQNGTIEYEPWMYHSHISFYLN